jgi:hypothetical protein
VRVISKTSWWALFRVVGFNGSCRKNLCTVARMEEPDSGGLEEKIFFLFLARKC